jgi:CIC family chloride channel protein
LIKRNFFKKTRNNNNNNLNPHQQAIKFLSGLNYPGLFDFSYLRKWTLIGILIGIVAGFSAVVFFLSVQFFTELFLGAGAGFVPPLPGGVVGGEGGQQQQHYYYLFIVERPWAFPLITGLGGLLVGLIVNKLAPEAEGHGTDAVIDAFHNKGGEIRTRIPFVKAIASAITLGSGGSGGTEGPTAQITAGLGSMFGRLFKLNSQDKRIAVAAGLGAGIGSIFKVPLGAALFSAEVFYRRDFEVQALLPSLIASVTGYTIFGFIFGWAPIFSIPKDLVRYIHPESLVLYAILGLVCAAASILYVRTFYAIQKYFFYYSKMKKVPNFLKPAVGGVLVGIIGIWLPQVLGPGYGWLQFAILGNHNLLPLWIILALVLFKMLATSLTIGSGGSAGVFGPSMVIGGLLGAFVGSVCHSFGLFTWIDVSSISIVGMVAFFSATAKTPLSTIIMGSEMTGGYALLAPMMLATFIAYAVSGQNNSIFKSQVAARSDSPAHNNNNHKEEK